MKIIPSIKNINFHGHAAGKIKALYMQNASHPSQILVYNELRKIGQEYNFDVFLHHQNHIFNNELIKTSYEKCNYQVWSQDNKTFLNKNGKPVLISSVCMPRSEKEEVESLSEIKKIEHLKPELYIKGGNFFIGKRFNGDRYLIIGMDDVSDSGAYHYLKEKQNHVSKENMREFLLNDILIGKDGKIIATNDEFSKNFEKYEKITLEKLRDTFDVDENNIVVLPQGQYHIDLSIRPLKYPFVLVADEKMSQENINKLKRRFWYDYGAKVFAQELEEKLAKQNRHYSSCDLICKHLKKNGFVPIRIGGGYGESEINFINSIVHKDKDDLIYITNSAECGNKYYEYLQKLFAKDLKEKCPQNIKSYFVKGLVLPDKTNVILDYLKKYRGGIHCLCAEEMEE